MFFEDERKKKKKNLKNAKSTHFYILIAVKVAIKPLCFLQDERKQFENKKIIFIYTWPKLGLKFFMIMWKLFLYRVSL